ncbi:MAG: hypothetical protein RSD78_04815 [Oscillospiraceae bacterium]
MELFNEKGHLTQDALILAINEELDEMQSLEVSEHLSFCDDCLVKYTDLLTDDKLRIPQKHLAPSIMSRWHRKLISFALSKYGTVAAAVVFGVAVWSTGIFSNAIQISQGAKPPVTEAQQKPSMVENASNFIGDITSELKSSVGGLFGTVTVQSEAERAAQIQKSILKEQARKEKAVAKLKAERQAAEKKKAEEKAKIKAKQDEQLKLEDAIKNKDNYAKEETLKRDEENINKLKEITAK